MNASDFSYILQANGYRVQGNRSQCPGHNGKDLNLSFSNGHDGKLLLTCFSHHCPVEDIAGSLGLSVSDLFPADDTFNKADYHQKKTQYQIEQECIHAYRMVAIFSADMKAGKKITEKNRRQAQEALQILDKNSFNHARYQQLMQEQAFNTAHQAWLKLTTEQKYRI